MSGGNDAQADGQGRVYQASGDQHITEHHHHAPDWTGPDSVRQPAVGRRPMVLRDRTGELDRLRAGLEPGVGNRVYVLHGLGGCGKTAVAYTIFNYAVTEVGRVGLWVNASDPASLRAGMLAVAADRGASDAELTGARTGLRPAADLVWDYLDRSGQPWLLILDNADDPAILRDGGWLRTSPAGTVIVTSRQAGAHWWPGAELLQFGVLARDQAALVLRDLAPEAGSIEDAAAVADRLGRLPLALILAGGFLAHQVINPWTLADYGRTLDGGTGLDPIDLIDQGSLAASSDSRQLVSRTWQLSLDVLAAHGIPEAVRLLRLLACWAGDPLPVSVLSGADLGPDLPASRVESALRGLLDQSLTELVPGTVRCLRTHSVLLDSVARTIGAGQREQTAAAAARLLLAVLPKVPQRGRQDPRVTLLAPHVLALLRRTVKWELGNSVVEAAAECALRLVIAIHRSGDYSSTLTLAREAADLATRCLGADNVFVIRLNQRIGRALFRLGEFDESERVLRQLFELCERVLGANSPDTLESCLKLGAPVANLGRTPEAIALYQRAVDGRMRLFGRSHPLTLRARIHLLEFAESADSGPELIADCLKTFGEDDQNTLGTKLSYAYALRLAGRYREAFPYARSAFDTYERLFGPDYPFTLNARETLGVVLAGRGNYADGIAHLEVVIEKRKRILGPGHPWIAANEKLLGGFRKMQDRT
jgi:tetratricopeptide (TPR) repeat protein